MRRLSLLVVLLFACEGDEGENAAPSCLEGEERAKLTIENRTGNAFETITMTACDMSETQEFPIPPPGLPDGEDMTINLPAPGCWILDYSGEGCESDPDHRAEEVCAGDTYVWTADGDAHVCVGR